MNWAKENKGRILVLVYVTCRSSKSELAGIYNNSLKIKLKSSPVNNAANEELVNFLAERLKLPKRNIVIISGHQQKQKLISIVGISMSLLCDRINSINE